MQEASKRDPAFVQRVFSLIEDGLTPEEILKQLYQDRELKELENRGEYTPPEKEKFSTEIEFLAQPFAFRVPQYLDLNEIHSLLSDAYKDETIGKEAFRSSVAIYREMIESLFDDKTFQWIIMEAPSGKSLTEDGAIIGVACFSTDGVSRKNGEVEGNLGSVRLFGILSQLRGLCIGSRLLSKVEQLMQQANCVRSMVSIPSTRESLMKWIERRDYYEVSNCPYPAQTLKQVLTNDDVHLKLFVKSLPPLLAEKTTKMNLSPIWRIPYKPTSEASTSQGSNGIQSELEQVD